ncbi:MAG: hypothetical protein HY243_12660, partial [Proteobacteria bacterium]|nr:hypothetical protein [Pseudomonadota bacterium]
MNKKRHLPPSESEIIQEIKARAAAIPNCEIIQSTVIKRGPQTFKVATVLQFKNPQTNEISHRELHLNDYPFRVRSGVKWEKKDRRAHWTCKDDEVASLRIFLETFDQASTPGEYSVIAGKPSPTLEELLKAVGTLDTANLV